MLNPTINATYDWLVRSLSDVVPLFPEPTLFLGGDEVDYGCFDRDPSVAAWMQANCHELRCCGNVTRCSRSMLGYFFRQVRERVMPRLPVRRALGVWLADADNADRPGCHGCSWNPVRVEDFAADTLFNVYQSLPTARLSLAANRSTVASIAFGSDGSVQSPWLGKGGWYLDQKPTFEDVWGLDPCKELGCDEHQGWRDNLLGGEACMWGSGMDGMARSADVDAFSGGMAAVAERLWTNPQVGEAAEAKARYHALACHWSIQGLPTFDRSPCAQWPCSPAGGSLGATPVDGPFTCASAWTEPVL